MRYLLLTAAAVLLLAGHLNAADWPTYNHDNRRSGATTQQLSLPLHLQWQHRAAYPPQPAWGDPAANDYFHRLYNLRSTVDFDRAFHVVAAGGRLYFGSSADCSLHCLDAETGSECWSYPTAGPIRLAPLVASERVYVGSDDGCLYCLCADDGRLIWRHNPPDDARLIPGNGRLISTAAIRSGLILDDDEIYFTSGLFPGEGVRLSALDAATGRLIRSADLDISAQGNMVASAEMLYIPTGRTAPVAFRRSDFANRGEFASAGGAYTLLADDVLITGPGRGRKQINADDAASRDTIATFDGLRMVIDGDTAYMQSETKLSAFNRTRHLQLARQRNALSGKAEAAEKKLKSLKTDSDEARQLSAQLDQMNKDLAGIGSQMNDCYLWTVDCDCPFSMILAGSHLIAGGDGKVIAVETATGKQVFNAKIQGKAHSLAVADRSLLVSTDAGCIYRFASEPESTDPLVVAGPARLVETAKGAAIAESTGITQGYCIILGDDRTELAMSLAASTQLNVILVTEKAAQAAGRIDNSGLNGRVIVLKGPLSELNFTSLLANLVICERADDSITKLVRPEGGVLWIDGPDADKYVSNFRSSLFAVSRMEPAVMMTRKPLPGAGQWTHLHAEPGGTSCSGDQIVASPVRLQWFGQPGPAEMIDRHHRNVAPLYKSGTLFVPGDRIIYAVDAYNGTVLWHVRTPDSRRLGVFLDSSNIAVDGRALYIAHADKCNAIDVETGRLLRTLTIPDTGAEAERTWGYLATVDGTVFGSTCKPGASYTETSYDADMALWYRNMKMVTSDSVFALRPDTAEPRWSYRNDTVIMNRTIVTGSGRMFFVETDNPKALADESGRLTAAQLFAEGRHCLTALDTNSGKPVFRQPIDTTNLQEPVCLNYADGVVLLSGSKLDANVVRYYYCAFDAETADQLWQTDHNSELRTDGGHGEYNRHPTVVGDTVYAWPYAYNLKTGKQLEGWKFDRRGHGCGGVSASAQSLFWRGLHPWMHELTPGGGPTRINTVTRPGCWINIIPAGGLVLIPEASSGCTCGYSLQTSLAYIPQSLLN